MMLAGEEKTVFAVMFFEIVSKFLASAVGEKFKPVILRFFMSFPSGSNNNDR